MDVSISRYLGIDPGLNRTGYALIERTRNGPVLKEAGVIRSTQKDSLAQRVAEIGTGIREVLEEFQPTAVAIEQVFSFGKNPKTALLMAHARGAILMVTAERKIPHWRACDRKLHTNCWRRIGGVQRDRRQRNGPGCLRRHAA